MITTQGLENTTDRGLGWRLLYPFIKDARFPKWNRKEAAELLIEETCPLSTKLFISHRWATPNDPDPKYQDLRTVVEYLTRIFMVANGLISEDSFVIKELVFGDELRSAFRESRLDQCRCGSDGWLDVRSLLENKDLFFQTVPDIMRRRKFYRLLKHVRVWYDYSSLPQARNTPKDEAFLDRALTHLADIVGQSETLALWGLESTKRAWCIFEVLAAKKTHFTSPALSKMGVIDKEILKSALSPDEPDKAEEKVAYRGRPSLSISITVNQFRRDVTGLSEQQIHEYLLENKIECTKPTDLVLLANLIHRYLVEDGERMQSL